MLFYSDRVKFSVIDFIYKRTICCTDPFLGIATKPLFSKKEKLITIIESLHVKPPKIG